MANTIVTAVCTSVKKQFFDGVHLPAHKYYCALVKPNAAGALTLGAATTTYDSLGAEEVANGNGYTTGGFWLQNRAVTYNGTTAQLDFDDAVWTGTISAIGCIVYNFDAAGHPALLVQDFGGTVSSTNAEFRVQITNLLTMA